MLDVGVRASSSFTNRGEGGCLHFSLPCTLVRNWLNWCGRRCSRSVGLCHWYVSPLPIDRLTPCTAHLLCSHRTSVPSSVPWGPCTCIRRQGPASHSRDCLRHVQAYGPEYVLNGGAVWHRPFVANALAAVPPEFPHREVRPKLIEGSNCSYEGGIASVSCWCCLRIAEMKSPHHLRIAPTVCGSPLWPAQADHSFTGHQLSSLRAEYWRLASPATSGCHST